MADDKEKNDNLSEVEQCQKWSKDRDTIQKNRSSFEKQWLVDISFLYGKHYFIIDKMATSGLEERVHWELKNELRQKKVRRTCNYILPLFRALLARLLSMKANIMVDATTSAERDKSSAQVSQEVLEDFWQMVNKHNPNLCQDYAGMLMIQKRLFTYILAIGTGYLKPYFNPKIYAKTFLENEIVEPTMPIGEVETKVRHAFDVFEDPMKQYKIEQSVLTVDEIQEQYDEKLEPEEITMTEAEQRLINLLEETKTEKYENAIRIFERWNIPCSRYPKGLYAVHTNKKILFKGDIPEEYKGRIPLFKFTYLDLLFSSFAQGMIEQVISLQEDLNYTITRIAAYKKWMAGKIMVDKNAKLETKWDDEIGQIIYHANGVMAPKYDAGPSAPQYLFEDIARIRGNMEDIVSVHDASLGRIPEQAKSGVAIEALSEMDAGALSPDLITIEQQLAFFSETTLDIMEKKYTEPRILGITGEEFGVKVRTFKGENVQGNRRIKISLGSALPSSKMERQKYIMTLQEKGYIDITKARELLQFGDVEGIYISLDENLQKEENQHLLEPGVSVNVEEWDDHTIHLKVITDFMKTKRYMGLDQTIKQKFIEHRKAHQTYLLQEQEAAARLTQGQPSGGK
jgi:hypothetical protein